MPDPDERLAPAPPEVTPSPAAGGLPSGWRAVVPDRRPLPRRRDYRLRARAVGRRGGAACAGLLAAGPGLRLASGGAAAPGAVSVVALTLGRAGPPAPEPPRPSLRRVAEGLGAARGRPGLIVPCLIDMA